MEKKYLAPDIKLNRIIERYWIWRSLPGETICFPPLFAGTGAELFFHSGTPFKLHEKNRLLPEIHLACPRNNTVINLLPSGNISFIAVRFRSWGLSNLTDIPVEELSNQMTDAKSIWNSSITEIHEQLQSAESDEEIKAILDSFFIRKLKQHMKQQEQFNRAVDFIYYNCSSLNMKSTVKNSTFSTRHFQRRFKEITGTSPKCFQKTARFQRILKSAVLTGSPPDLEKILDTGYYDQSHFIKDFKNFTNHSPSDYFRKNISMAHFYNTSLNSSDKL